MFEEMQPGAEGQLIHRQLTIVAELAGAVYVTVYRQVGALVGLLEPQCDRLRNELFERDRVKYVSPAKPCLLITFWKRNKLSIFTR